MDIYIYRIRFNMPGRRNKALLVDIVGQKFGNLTVLRELPEEKRPDGGGYRRFFECQCDCGNIKPKTSYDNLKATERGKPLSCGCIVKIGNNLKHGQNRRGQTTPEYKAWSSMINRCTNPNYYLFHRYGGRGIRVCDRWLNSFENFFADMEQRPSPEHSIDRINNDGNYEPGNCRWADRITQANNRDTHAIVVKGWETKKSRV